MYEIHDIVALSISTIKPLLRQQMFSIPEDNLIFDAYEELAIFIISNFDIPSSHEEYIAKNLGIQTNYLQGSIKTELENHLKNTKGNFSLEFPLRALEVYFSYGKPLDMDLNILMKLKYLISKLHHLVGENYRF
ncbi:hypothetical protein [Flavobacterium aquidurense]|uniref:Uncharacterized protein n=1 Tax=Flavobacterium aquidurense TaxID=362413 RepID=A0A0Q0S7B1_9FLAO|nr:hypothetical protein [Flavobacterium aquidurense]KQB39422.1 hypothetical protein RC62_1103 [Flavobacterium aquidurense]